MSNNPLLVGVDVHRKTNTICLMNRYGQEIGQRLSVPNNRQGTATLARAIGAKQSEKFARLHRKADVIDSKEMAVVLVRCCASIALLILVYWDPFT